jgi:hypothetical protein
VAARRSASDPVEAREVRASDSLYQDTLSVGGGRHGSLTFSAIGMLAEHHVTPNGNVNTLESQSGLMIGGAIDWATGSWLSVHAEMSTGKLAAESGTAARDQTATDARIEAAVAAFPWLSFVGGVGARSYNDVALQRWVFIRTGAEAHFNLGGGPISGVLRLTLLPMVSAGQGQEAPSFGMISAAGVQYESRKLVSSLIYVIERYGFSGTASARLEQFSGLQFRLGLRFAR